jgi:hypothetical protein
MSKKCLIRQPAGLGDILFCQKIAKRVIKDFDLDVIWPVIPEFKDVIPYITSDRITYVDASEDFEGSHLYHTPINNVVESEDFIYVPLQHADQLRLDESVMVSKYKQVNLDYEDWPDYLTITRNFDKEDKLYKDVLGLDDQEDYVLVNKNYGSPPDSRKCDRINVISEKRIVNMDYYDGFNLFDWCKVVEGASEIHTVDTALVCIAEKLKLCDNLNIYSRWNPSNFQHVKPMLYVDWEYHY